MNIRTERLDNHTARLTVEFGVERLEKAKQQAAKALSKRYRIPGFRPGKAPYKIIVNHVGEASILEDAIELLSNEIYRDALNVAPVIPYGPGAIENFSIDPPTFVFSLPLQPEVDLKNYRDVREEYTHAEVTDDQVDRSLRQLQRQEALVEESHQPAAMGNQVTVDIHSEFVDGEERPETKDSTEHDHDHEDDSTETDTEDDDSSDEFDADDDSSDEFDADDDSSDEFDADDDSSDEFDADDDSSDEFDADEDEEDVVVYKGDGFVHRHDAVLTLSTEEEPVLTGFSQALVGANVGDNVVFELEVPDEEGYKGIVGRKVQFNVSVKKIEVITLPELNDDFAARVTKDEAEPLTLLQLRMRIRENMQREAQDEADDKYANLVLDKIIEQAQVAFPPQMIDERVHDMMHDFEENVLRRQGLSLETYQQISGMSHEDFHRAYEPAAERYVKRSLALSEFVVREKLKVADEDIDARIEDMIKLLGGDNQAGFRAFLNTDAQRDKLRNSMLYQAAMKHLVLLGKGELPEPEPEAVSDVEASDSLPAESAKTDPAVENEDQTAVEAAAAEPNSNPSQES